MRKDRDKIQYKYIVDKISTTKHKIKQKDYLQRGQIPIIDQGKEVIGGYTNDETRILKYDLPLIVFGDHTKVVKLINFCFAPGADGTKVLKPRKFVYPKYIAFLTEILVFKIKDKGYARHYQHIEKQELPIAPLPEQRAIVAKLEQLFSKLDNSVKNLKSAKNKLEIYRQAVLKNAFEGELTKSLNHDSKNLQDKHDLPLVTESESTYKDHSCQDNQKNQGSDNLSKGWEKISVGNICDCIVPNRDKPKTFNGSIPWITTPDLDEENINIDYSKIELGLTKDEILNYKAKVIPVGSVIMTCVGKFGITAVVEKESVINQQLHAFLPSNQIVPKYLAYALKTQKDYMTEISTAITISYLNKKNCNSVPINIPPTLTEQHQIVRKIEFRLSVCNKLDESIDQSLEKAEALRQSILKKAFEGELLSNEEIEACKKKSDWEPAEKLLERIKKEK